MGVLVISLGITLSLDRTKTQFVTTTSRPTTSAVPSFRPTGTPSSSQMPSSTPTACSLKITTNTRQIELLRPDPTSPIVAVKGKNLVVVWKQFTGTFQLEGSFYTAFYSLSDDEWKLAGYSVEGNVRWNVYDNRIGYDVALSDLTAVIGLPARNLVYVYRQNSAGLWEKVASPQPNNQVSDCGGFGSSVDICDDMIVVSDSSYCSGTRSWAQVSENADYIFKQIDGKWEEIGRVSSADITGDDTVALDAIQDVRDCGANAQAVADEGEICIHQKNDTIRLNSSEYGNGFGHSLAMDNGILVVGSTNHTHIFSQENDGSWEEILKLDEVYDSYEMSERTLITTNENKVYSINIADCTPELPVPVQPLLNGAKECYPVNISVSFKYDGGLGFLEKCIPQGWSTWEVSILTDELIESDSTVEKTMAPRDDQECGYTDSTTCLPPGRYKLKLHTDWTQHCYNVTLNSPGGQSNEPAIKFQECTPCHVLDGDVAVFDVPFNPPETSYPTSQTTVSENPFPTHTPTATQWPTPVTWSPTTPRPPSTPFSTEVYLTRLPNVERPMIFSSPAHLSALCNKYTTRKTCIKVGVGCAWDKAASPSCSSS